MILKNQHRGSEKLEEKLHPHGLREDGVGVGECSRGAVGGGETRKREEGSGPLDTHSLALIRTRLGPGNLQTSRFKHY